jgi:sulfate permease
MGGSGTGPAFSAAFGANFIRLRYIAGLFGVMVFVGAIIGGEGTAKTIGKELLNPDLMNVTIVSIILFSVAISLLVANLAGIPQSTSQSTVLAIVAPALYFNQFSSKKLFVEIIPAWFILPIIAFIICLLIGKYIYKPLRKTGITISTTFNKSKIIKATMIFMSLYVAFSIGANNVANAAGPISSLIINELDISLTENFAIIMLLATLIVAPSFGIGSSIFGYKILRNTGKEIFLFGKFEAIIIAFVSASLLLSASLIKGIPTSLVQLNVGAILGIGVSKLGFKQIFRKTQVNKFFAMWLIAPLISFVLSMTLIFIAAYIGLI